MKAKIIAISLLLVFALPIIGTYGWLSYRKTTVKLAAEKYLQQGVQREELVRLAFHSLAAETELRWEHPGEFEFGGRMYDVVEKTTRGDSLILVCWWDREETRVNKELASLGDQETDRDDKHKDNRDRRTRQFLPLYLIQQNSQKTGAPGVMGKPLLYYTFSYSAPIPDPPTPPPRRA